MANKPISSAEIRDDALAILNCGDMIHTKKKEGIDAEDVDLFGEIRRRAPKIAKWATANGISISALMPLVDSRSFLDLFAAWGKARPVVREIQTKAAAMATPSKRRKKLEGEALLILHDHPKWSNKDIAKAVPCHVQSLYRWSTFQLARQQLKNEARRSLPRGRRNHDGGIEAYTEDTR